MRRAGLVVAETLELLREAVRPGVTTADLDAVAEQHIRSRGATSNFLNYHGFPATICASVNDEIVHGIPGDRVLHEGDIVSIDCGAIVDGWHGDAAITVPVGEVTADADRAHGGHRGRAVARVRRRYGSAATSPTSVMPWSRTSASAATTASSRSTSGTASAPPCTRSRTSPTTARPGRGPELVPGLVLAVEPMVNLGSRQTRQLDDGWTVVTQDGQRSAHFEHTFTLTPDGPWVLTALDGGRARFEALGIGVPAFG